MPGRSREERRKSKVYKLKMQGRVAEQPKVEKKVEKEESKPKKEKVEEE